MVGNLSHVYMRNIYILFAPGLFVSIVLRIALLASSFETVA